MAGTEDFNNGEHGVLVTQGQIVVNSVERVTCTPTAVMYEIDCRSKYPWPSLGSHFVRGEPESWTLMLLRDDNTLYAADTDIPTTIDFPPLDGEFPWWSFVDHGRYSVRVVFVQPGQVETVYHRD